MGAKKKCRNAVQSLPSPGMTVPPNLDWPLSVQWNADLEKYRDFRVVLLYYKCRPCLQYKGRCLGTLDCPGFHSDMDRRRSPAQYNYDSTPCVRVKPSRNSSWKEPSACPLGDSCTFCHTRAEQQLHPDVYRTVRCRDHLRDGRCPRLRFCAFSHNEDELQELIDFWQAFKHTNRSQLIVFSPTWRSSPSPPVRQTMPYVEKGKPLTMPIPAASAARERGSYKPAAAAVPTVNSMSPRHGRPAAAPALRRKPVAVIEQPAHELVSSDESPEPSPTDDDIMPLCGGLAWASQSERSDVGSRLARLSMAIDHVVASETSRELRIETCLQHSQPRPRLFMSGQRL